MPNTMQVTAAVNFLVNGVTSVQDGGTAFAFNVTGSDSATHSGWATSTGETAIPLSGLVGPFGWYFFKNTDSNNSIKLRTASGINPPFSTLPPGGVAIGYFDSTVTAPTAQATAGAPQLRFDIFQI